MNTSCRLSDWAFRRLCSFTKPVTNFNTLSVTEQIVLLNGPKHLLVLQNLTQKHYCILWDAYRTSTVTWYEYKHCDMGHVQVLWHGMCTSTVTWDTYKYCDMGHVQVLWHGTRTSTVTWDTYKNCDMVDVQVLWHGVFLWLDFFTNRIDLRIEWPCCAISNGRRCRQRHDSKRNRRGIDWWWTGGRAVPVPIARRCAVSPGWRKWTARGRSASGPGARTTRRYRFGSGYTLQTHIPQSEVFQSRSACLSVLRQPTWQSTPDTHSTKNHIITTKFTIKPITASLHLRP